MAIYSLRRGTLVRSLDFRDADFSTPVQTASSSGASATPLPSSTADSPARQSGGVDMHKLDICPAGNIVLYGTVVASSRLFLTHT